MGHNGDYYGYDANDNDRLTELRYLSRRTGDNLTEYGDSSVGSEYFQDYKQTYKPPPGGDPNDPTSSNYDYWDKKDAYGRTGASGDGVEAIYHRIMAQNPDKVQALIDHWRGVAEALRAVSETVTSHTDTVAKSWSSPGASQFFALGPGAALKSLNDWQLAADHTASALQIVYADLLTNRDKITKLYNEYKAEVGAYQDEIGGTGIDSAKEIKGDKYGFSQRYTQYVAQIQEKYTYRAQVIESALSDAYWDGYNGVVGSTPGVYEGPTNAVAAPPGAFFDVPHGPSGFPGGAPPGVIPPGLKPSGPPTALNAAKPGPPPGPVTPGKAPVAPVTPVAAKPVAPIAPVAPPAPPVAPVAPVAPAVIPPGTIGPPRPGGGPAPVPARLVAPGVPTAPVVPPGTPALPPGTPGQPAVNLPKTLAKGGVLKPGAPGNPNLPPSPGRSMPPGAPGAGRRPNAPQSRLSRPVLGGSHPQTPGANPPGMPGGGRRPNAPGGPGGVRAGRPGAPGGLPPSPFGGGPKSAAPPVLGGRGARPGEPGYQGGRPGPGAPGTPGSRLPGAPGSRTPGAPGAPGPRVPGAELPGSPQGPRAPGATRPVLNRSAGSTPEEPSVRRPEGRRTPQGRLPGGLSDPFGLTSRNGQARSASVLRPSGGARRVVGTAGVPQALRGASQRPDTQADAGRPVVQADLAAREMSAPAAVPVPQGSEAVAEQAVEVPVVRDEDVFVPVTPGGPVLANGKRPKEYEAEERVALPGADGRPPSR